MRFYVKEGNCVKFDGFNKDVKLYALIHRLLMN